MAFLRTPKNAVFIKTGSDTISKNYKISDKFNSEKWMSGFSDLSVYISLSVSRRFFYLFCGLSYLNLPMFISLNKCWGVATWR